MTGQDWSRELKDSPFHDDRSATGQPARAPIDIVIGLDYGTRFTKIGVGIGRERFVWEDDAKNRLIPSIVYITADNSVLSYPLRPPPAGSEKIEYLKMLLADADENVFRSVRPLINGKPIRDLTRPLAAVFLSNLVRYVRASLLKKLPELNQRKVNWLLNVGAPVQHCDSNVSAFKEVAAVAFNWAQQSPSLVKIDDYCAAYAETARKLDISSSPAAVVPELTAALREFVTDPNRADDFYGFIDIGGGTLDGAIFRVNRSESGFPLRVHAAQVDTAGTMALSRSMLVEIYSKLSQYIESPLLGSDENPSIKIPLSESLRIFTDDQSAKDRIQRVVARVIVKTSKQLYGGYLSPRIDATATNTPPLRIFLSGGGARSAWYKATIEKTFADWILHQYGVTGIRTEIVAKPATYQGNDFTRFVIALGLADLDSALTDAQLPRDIPDAEPLPAHQPRVPLYEQH